MYICAGNIEQFDFAKPIGIGLINVASNLTELILSEKPKSLTFIGTAGSYGNYTIFDIVETSTATNIESSFFTHKSYTPLKRELVSRETVVNSTNYITTSEKVATYFLKNHIDLENMELYSVLEVAKKYHIPVKGILIITNYCNADAHKDFKKNHQKAMEKLTRYIVTLK
jgi:nucleoside phosphorylase